MPTHTTVTAFLLALPALFSIVNPLGMAFIVEELIGELPRADRGRLVGRVGLYALCIMLGALWAGSDILRFFGVSIDALRLAGGLVISLSALELLLRPGDKQARKLGEATDTTRRALDMAFFPITLPLTTGPGTIAVAVALGAERPEAWPARLAFLAGVSGAALAMAGLIWAVYSSTDRLTHLFSPTAQRIVSRLGAFLLLCIGMQIMIGGAEGVVVTMAAHLRATAGGTP